MTTNTDQCAAAAHQARVGGTEDAIVAAPLAARLVGRAAAAEPPRRLHHPVAAPVPVPVVHRRAATAHALTVQRPAFPVHDAITAHLVERVERLAAAA